MPVYTYRCENCGIQFERQQKFSDTPLQWCPECNQKALRKVYTPVGIVFKGSGFYATDHRSASGGNSARQPAKSKESEGATNSQESAPAKSAATNER
ncbi:MAG: zinc ribbon domain-containing protein [Anaerolineales bacterium]